MQYVLSFLVLKSSEELVAYFYVSFRCIVAVIVLWIFFTMQWVSLQCLIVEYPDHMLLLITITIDNIVSLR